MVPARKPRAPSSTVFIHVATPTHPSGVGAVPGGRLMARWPLSGRRRRRPVLPSRHPAAPGGATTTSSLPGGAPPPPATHLSQSPQPPGPGQFRQPAAAPSGRRACGGLPAPTAGSSRFAAASGLAAASPRRRRRVVTPPPTAPLDGASRRPARAPSGRRARPRTIPTGRDARRASQPAPLAGHGRPLGHGRHGDRRAGVPHRQ